MRGLAPILLLLAACRKEPPPPVVADPPRTAMPAPIDERAAAQAEIERGEFASAEQRLTALLRAAPTADLYALRATVRERLGREDEALDDLGKAVALAGERTDLRRRRVPLLEKRAMWAELALDLDAIGDDALRLKRAGAKARAGDHTGAIRDYDALIAAEPENDELRLERARSSVEVGDWQGAVADVTHVLLKKPTAALYGMRGHVHWRLRVADKATADFRKGLELDPGDVSCNLGMAEILVKREPARCVEYATRGIEADRTRANLWFLRATARLYLDERGTAADDFARAGELDPSLKELGAHLLTIPRDQLLRERQDG